MAAKRIKLLLFGITCSVMTSFAQSEQNLALLISKSDGVAIGYCLEKLPVLAFEDNMLKVTNEGVTESFLWEDIVSLSYVKESSIPSQILSLEKKNASVIFFKDGLSVYSYNDNHPISVYDANGRVVFSKSSKLNTPMFIEYSQFSHGLYILKSGNNNIKFYVK